MMVLPFILDFLKPPKLLIMRPDARKAGIELKAAFAIANSSQHCSIHDTQGGRKWSSKTASSAQPNAPAKMTVPKATYTKVAHFI